MLDQLAQDFVLQLMLRTRRLEAQRTTFSSMMIGQHRQQNVHLANRAEKRHSRIGRQWVAIVATIQLLDIGRLLLEKVVEECGQCVFGHLFGETILQRQLDVEFAQFVVDGGTEKRPPMVDVAVERASLLVERPSSRFTQADATFLGVSNGAAMLASKAQIRARFFAQI